VVTVSDIGLTNAALSSSGFERWFRGSTVLLVDDNREDAARFQTWLTEADATVLTAGTARGAQSFIPSHGAQFDVAVVGAHGLDEETLMFAMQVKKLQPGCGVLVQTAQASGALMMRLRQIGASYLSKGACRADFMFTVARLLEGEIPDVEMLVARAQRRWQLSRQQTRLLYYNLWCCSNDEIAKGLGVSLNTVQEYQQKLRSKTGARAKDGYFRLLMETAGRQPPVRPRIQGQEQTAE
jgi:DNA-binding NarL/FixJ family response regulator